MYFPVENKNKFTLAFSFSFKKFEWVDGSEAKKNVTSGTVMFPASVEIFPFQLGWSELVAQPDDLSDILDIWQRNIVQLGWSEPG